MHAPRPFSGIGRDPLRGIGQRARSSVSVCAPKTTRRSQDVCRAAPCLPRILAAALLFSWGLVSGASAEPGAVADADGWDFDLSLYGWLTDLTGDVSVGDTTVDVDLQLWNDVLKEIEGAAFGIVEARYRNRWILNTDLFFGGISLEREKGPFPIAFGPATLERDLGARTTSIDVETPIGDLEIPARLDPGTLRADIPRVETAIGPFDIETKLMAFMARGQLGYRAVDAPLPGLLGGGKDDPRRIRFDLLAGLRYYYVKTEISIEAPPASVPPFEVTPSVAGGSVRVGGDRLPGRTKPLGRIELPGARFSGGTLGGTNVDVEESVWWIDPLVGLRVGIDVSARLRLALNGNVGGFGLGSASDFSWDVGLFGRYLLGEHWSLVGGYRALGFERESSDVKLDLILHGPAIGVIYRF